MSNEAHTAQVLKLTLHGDTVGHLVGFQGGHNRLIFADAFRRNPSRATFTLTTHPAFPRAGHLMAQPWRSHQRLHPVLSNLLPEGALREQIAQTHKIHIDDDFSLLAALGQDLPGAVIAQPVSSHELPDQILAENNLTNTFIRPANQTRQFSLAGVQLKFSLTQKDQRYTVPADNNLGNWIVKTPSARHKYVPANEYTTMKLAELIGVDIPEIRLIETGQLDGWITDDWPNEPFAYAITRFDRDGNHRIHMEDFAQVLAQYPHQKYRGGNSEQIARILYQYSGNALADAQQLARRLLANILLANGDAHLKNWSLIYPNQVTPRLAPAYDLLNTRAYIHQEAHLALNLGRNKAWYEATFDHFERWAKKADLPWRAIKPHLVDAMTKARTQWPQALHELPMARQHQQILIDHWHQLQPDFRIVTQ